MEVGQKVGEKSIIQQRRRLGREMHRIRSRGSATVQAHWVGAQKVPEESEGKQGDGPEVERGDRVGTSYLMLLLFP